MKLGAWMQREKVSQSEISRRTGIDQSLICKYLKKKRRPAGEHIQAIREATGGEVDLDDWVGQVRRKKAAA